MSFHFSTVVNYVYLVFSNKAPRAYLNLTLYGTALIGGRHIKEKKIDAIISKYKNIVHMKFLSFVIFFFQMTINNCPFDL